MEKKPKPIYILDYETDPFVHGALPKPFAAGLYADGEFFCFWGSKCVSQVREKIETLEPGVIYAHNGGRFDIFYNMDWLSGKMLMINSRIVKAEMPLAKGKHEIRDSYSIMPFPLRDYKKDEIDYNKMKREVREQHKEEIISYLKGDCVYLYELCTRFIETFGDQLTIGATALKELKKIHSFTTLSESQDHLFRGVDKKLRDENGYEISNNKVTAIKPPTGFYYGGRVQCFKDGVINAPVKVYDVNSMYPHVMQSYLHPVGHPTSTSKKVGKNTCFVLVEGRNYGAFPVREKTGIRFDVEYGTFGVSIHEWKAALSLGLFEPTKIITCHNFDDRRSFAEFVTTFYNLRKKAQEMGDDILALFYKYILNSAYGKFAQNPENYFEYEITEFGEILPNIQDKDAFGNLINPGPWMRDWIVEDKYIIWKKPCLRFVRHNVASAASITGAARSVLMHGLAKSTNPYYCDTDSIICEDLSGVEISDKVLGGWKLEAEGNRLAIAGKKMYALFDNDISRIEKAKKKAADKKTKLEIYDGINGKEICVKLASKGVRLQPHDIEDVALGNTYIYEKDSPSFKWDGSHSFIRREVRRTA